MYDKYAPAWKCLADSKFVSLRASCAGFFFVIFGGLYVGTVAVVVVVSGVANDDVELVGEKTVFLVLFYGFILKSNEKMHLVKSSGQYEKWSFLTSAN